MSGATLTRTATLLLPELISSVKLACKKLEDTVAVRPDRNVDMIMLVVALGVIPVSIVTLLAVPGELLIPFKDAP